MNDTLEVLLNTVIDVLPIFTLIVLFQTLVLKKKIPKLRRVILGGVYVVVGLALFLIGLEKALFPIGELMAEQLSDPEFLGTEGVEEGEVNWTKYYWVYIFAALIGFSTTIAEPSLIAVAMKAKDASGGAIGQWTLRIVVALGVAVALVLGTYRIVIGASVYWFILGAYLVVILQTIFVPKKLVALAYDSGGVTTSTVTVPLVTALGIGIASAVPGRDPAIDGFGLIAFASVFPIIAVLAYAQYVEWVLNQKRD